MYIYVDAHMKMLRRKCICRSRSGLASWLRKGGKHLRQCATFHLLYAQGRRGTHAHTHTHTHTHIHVCTAHKHTHTYTHTLSLTHTHIGTCTAWKQSWSKHSIGSFWLETAALRYAFRRCAAVPSPGNTAQVRCRTGSTTSDAPNDCLRVYVLIFVHMCIREVHMAAPRPTRQTTVCVYPPKNGLIALWPSTNRWIADF